MSDTVINQLWRRFGDPREMLEAQRRMDRDSQYAFKHTEEWRRAYPNHWIAVRDLRLVAAESSVKALHAALQKQGMTARDSFVTFLREENLDIVLRL